MIGGLRQTILAPRLVFLTDDLSLIADNSSSFLFNSSSRTRSLSAPACTSASSPSMEEIIPSVPSWRRTTLSPVFKTSIVFMFCVLCFIGSWTCSSTISIFSSISCSASSGWRAFFSSSFSILSCVFKTSTSSSPSARACSSTFWRSSPIFSSRSARSRSRRRASERARSAFSLSLKAILRWRWMSPINLSARRSSGLISLRAASMISCGSPRRWAMARAFERPGSPRVNL